MSNPERPSGTFVVLEGIDGSGSTTQARKLVQTLNESGRYALFTCEPSDGPVGQLIRAVLEHRLLDQRGAARSMDWVSMALLFAADRAEHVQSTVRPALERGAVVVSDRYDLSSLAYQSVSGGSPAGALGWIRELNSRVPRPDLTIVLDVSAEVAAQRRRERAQIDELFDVPELQRRLAEVYASAEELSPEDRILHIDGEASLDAVARAVLQAVQFLEKRPGSTG
jgi:dTMP kinase